jgi:hypothetical protein
MRLVPRHSDPLMAYNSVGRVRRTGRATLDSNGNGQVMFDVPSANHRWILESVVVNVSGAAPGLYPQVVLYVGGVQSSGLSEGATWTGNQQTFTGRIDMDSGITLMVAFIKGPAAAMATAIIEGEAELWQ